ncbi:MAG TPA: hypothetical protein VH498_06290 [Candidatus Dormibacteraeota bacterium]|nr:hypothetical protein [Candidatus Dormibacteraeota bacterium]
MADRRVSWDTNNRKHIVVDHAERGITEEQVTYAVENAVDENVAPDPIRGTTVGLCRIGRRVLAVAWVTRPGGWCYPVHAHWAGRKERRAVK